MAKRRLDGRAYRVEYWRIDSDGEPCVDEPIECSFVYVAREFPELASIIARDGFNKIDYEWEGERVLIQERECWRHEQQMEQAQAHNPNSRYTKVNLVIGNQDAIYHQEWLSIEDGNTIQVLANINWNVEQL